MAVNRGLYSIAERQDGYFTASQATQAGYSRHLQAYHSKKGNWRRLSRGLYRLKNFPDTVTSELFRWMLWAGKPGSTRSAALSHESALYHYGLQTEKSHAVHLTLPRLREDKTIGSGLVQHPGFLEPGDYVAEEGGLIFTTPFRTLQDLKPDLLYQGRWLETVRMAQHRGLIGGEEARTLLVGTAPPPETRTLLFSTGQAETARIEGPKGWKMPNRSFTLVEMLVVIAIIAVLAALLMPALDGALGSARQAFCANMQRQYYLGWNSYADDYNDWCPIYSAAKQTTNWLYYVDGSAKQMWEYGLAPYLGLNAKCNLLLRANNPFYCPVSVHYDAGYTGKSYGIGYNMTFGTYYGAGGLYNKTMPRKRGKQPGRLVLFGDTTSNCFMWQSWWAGGDGPVPGLSTVHGGGTLANIIRVGGDVSGLSPYVLVEADLLGK